MIGIDLSPRLKVTRVVVTGELGCDIRLGSGLNIIRGEAFQGNIQTSNDCGKTLFTNLVKYGLGDRDRFSTGEIAKSIDLLFLEVELNDNVYTIVRNLIKPLARVSIYEDRYQPSLTREPDFQVNPSTPFSDFILERLGIPRVRIPQSNKPGAIIRPITFQDFMRVLYMDQKNSFQEIMHGVQPEWYKTKTLQILLGMSSEEEDQFALRIQKLTDDISFLEREINNITDFLTRSSDANLLETNEKRTQLIRQLEEQVIRIDELKRQMRGQRGVTDDLRAMLDTISHQLADLHENRSKLFLKIKDFQALHNSLTVDKERVLKTQEASRILSTVDFVICPRCLQRVTAEMKHRESQDECMLCGRPLLTVSERTRVLDKDEIVEEEIMEVQVLQEKYQSDLQNLINKIEELAKEKARLQEELDKQSQSYVSPFIDELERLLHERNRINANIEVLYQRLRQWSLLGEREQKLDELRTEREKLRVAAAAINTRDDAKVRSLSQYYERFLRNVGFPNLSTARIQSSDLMPLVNGHPYTEDTGIGFVSVKVIGFHHALLEFSLDNPCYYPRFLMLDSPRAFDINPQTYDRMLLQFPRLLDKLGNVDFQIIITTRNLPQEMEEYVIERLNSKNRMLLRPKEQREQSSFPQ